LEVGVVEVLLIQNSTIAIIMCKNFYGNDTTNQNLCTVSRWRVEDNGIVGCVNSEVCGLDSIEKASDMFDKQIPKGERKYVSICSTFASIN
jgi:hypothetical protein